MISYFKIADFNGVVLPLELEKITVGLAYS